MIFVSKSRFLLWMRIITGDILDLHRQLNRIQRTMANQADLDAKLDELQAAITTELQQLADAIAAQAPDLAPQVARVQSLVDALKADDPAAPSV